MKRKIIYRILMSCIFIIPILLSILVACGNRQWIGGEVTNNTFNKAIVDYGNGTVETYDIKQWTDFEKSDMVQFVDTDGNVYLTHSSKVVLKYEK